MALSFLIKKIGKREIYKDAREEKLFIKKKNVDYKHPSIYAYTHYTSNLVEFLLLLLASRRREVKIMTFRWVFETKEILKSKWYLKFYNK